MTQPRAGRFSRTSKTTNYGKRFPVALFTTRGTAFIKQKREYPEGMEGNWPKGARRPFLSSLTHLRSTVFPHFLYTFRMDPSLWPLSSYTNLSTLLIFRVDREYAITYPAFRTLLCFFLSALQSIFYPPTTRNYCSHWKDEDPRPTREICPIPSPRLPAPRHQVSWLSPL